MNANELADILEILPNMSALKAATMLRQQQAEIEHLKELFGCDPAYYERSAKTLTDEEIGQVWKNMPPDNDSGLAFARAILRKAQEK
jgi:hypothetical protein